MLCGISIEETKTQTKNRLKRSSFGHKSEPWVKIPLSTHQKEKNDQVKGKLLNQLFSKCMDLVHPDTYSHNFSERRMPFNIAVLTRFFFVVVVAKKSRSDFSDATNVSSLIGQCLISIFLKVWYCLQPSEVRIYVSHFLIMKYQ